MESHKGTHPSLDYRYIERRRDRKVSMKEERYRSESSEFRDG